MNEEHNKRKRLCFHHSCLSPIASTSPSIACSSYEPAPPPRIRLPCPPSAASPSSRALFAPAVAPPPGTNWLAFGFKLVRGLCDVPPRPPPGALGMPLPTLETRGPPRPRGALIALAPRGMPVPRPCPGCAIDPLPLIVAPPRVGTLGVGRLEALGPELFADGIADLVGPLVVGSWAV